MKVASLEFDLLANIARLQQDMTKAQQIMGRSLNAMEQSIQRTMNTFNRLGGAFAMVLGGSVADKILEMADDWGQYASRMKMATQSTAEYERAQSRMMQSAQATFRPINETREAFINLSPVLRDMGMTLDQSIDAVDAFSGLLVTAGANAQRGASAMSALEKSFQRGKVSAQDWMTIYSTADGILEHLQITTGKSAEELRRLGVDGKLSATQLANALTSAYGPVMEQVAQMPTTVGDAMTNMRTALGEYIGSMNDGFSVTAKIADGITLLSENIDLLMVGVGVLSAAALPALIGKITALTVAIAANPIGLLAVGIAASIAYLISLRDEVDKFGKEMDALGAVWDTAKGGFVAIWEVGKSVFDSIVQKVSGSTEGMELSFDSAFMGITGALDTFHGAFFGSFSALGALWDAASHNLVASFSLAFEKVKEQTSKMMGTIAEALNQLPGVNISVSAYKAAENIQFKNIADEMAKAFNEHKGGLGLQSIYKTASDARKMEREIKQLEQWYNELSEESDGVTTSLLKNSEALDKNKQKLTEAQKAAKKFAEERLAAFKDQAVVISNLHKEAQALEDQVKYFGQNKRALEALEIARLRERATLLAGFEGSKEQIALIEQEIEARERLLQAGFTLEALENGKKAADDLAETAKRTHDDIEKSLTDALLRGFESGKGFGRNFIDTLKNMFSSLVLRPIIQPIAAGAAGMITGALGFGGAANAQGAGGGIDPLTGASMAQRFLSGGAAGPYGMSGGMSWFTGFGGNVSNLAADLGANLTMMDGAFSNLGSTLLNNAEAIGQFADIAGQAFGYGSAIYDLTKGKYGAAAGGAIGQYFGGPIGSFIGSKLGGMLDKAFKGETRAGAYMQYDLAAKQAVVKGGPSGGYGGQATIDAATQLFGSTVDTINSVLEGVGAQAQTAWFHGMFESSKKGRGGTFAGGSMQLADGSLVDFGTNKKGAGFGGKSGTAEEMFANLQTEVHFAALEAWKAVGSEMPTMISDMLTSIDVRALSAEQAQGLVAEISNTVGVVNSLSEAFNQMPMLNLRDLTFDATANLAKFAGGFEQIKAGVSTYFQSFYSQEEQLTFAAEQLTQSFSGLGLQIPDVTQGAAAAKAEFRATVEALDLSTESGQQAYATLMALSGGFSEVVLGFDELNGVLDSTGEAARSVGDILREREQLERQLLQLQGNTEELRRRDLAALDASNHGLQRQIWALQDQASAADAASAAYSALQKSVDAERTALRSQADSMAASLRSAIDGASGSVRELEGLTGKLSSTVSSMMRTAMGESRGFAWAQNRLDQALSVTKLTGVMPQGQDFEQALEIAAKPSEGLYGSFEDYQLDFLRTAHVVDALSISAEDQLSTERRALKSLEDQYQQSQLWYKAEMERLDLLLDHEREAIDIARGTYQTVLSIPQALAGIRSALGGLAASQQSVGIATSGIRSFDVGTNQVPNDMLAFIHKDERIIPAADNRALMSMLQRGSNQSNDIRLLQQEIRELRSMLAMKLDEGNRHTANIDRTNRQMVEQPTNVIVSNIVETIELKPGE